MSTKITVINGPNLNLLHLREASTYGEFSLESLENYLTNQFPEITFDFFQSNIEGEIINKIHACIEDSSCIVINPGGYAHSSVAIRDALELCKQPKIEVHLSNIHQRESFRHHSITATVCDGVIAGLKQESYVLAIEAIKRLLL